MAEFQQHPTKITLVVIDEYALACMFPESNRAQVISASVAFGSSYRDGDIVVVRANDRILRKVRIATQRDFDEFRVARSNYMGREHEYHFITENNEDAT